MNKALLHSPPTCQQQARLLDDSYEPQEPFYSQ